ncbi:MAG: bifunctional adenosylcobinamide kinase/adenosylcobinamide-phosphate guanylyltransferase [Rubrobacter sp.]|nr:bifunctional adenosylcobinamide kinase/adenosylcobinamide-phosphate guanylyltransferase [Rubrobacter sp.]
MAVHALILGGARSGKSTFAEKMAAELGGARVLYVATADVSGDEDLARRVRKHKERRPATWGTVEAGEELSAALGGAGEWGAVLVDSLTLWVSARMISGEDEPETLCIFDRFLDKADSLKSAVILVSDEVGLGVVPESAAGRRFRDLLGLVNQRAAAAVAEVHLCVAGLGVRIK